MLPFGATQPVHLVMRNWPPLTAKLPRILSHPGGVPVYAVEKRSVMPTGPVATAFKSTPVGSAVKISRMALRLPAFGGSKVTVTLRVAPGARLTPSSAPQFAVKSPTVARASPLIRQDG